MKITPNPEYTLFALLFICQAVLSSQSEEAKEPGIAGPSAIPAKDAADIDYVAYTTPEPPSDVLYLYDSFDDVRQFKKDWVSSQATKGGSKEYKYNGTWDLVVTHRRIRGDYGIRMKNKSRHHAIARKMERPFHFTGADLIVQYDIQYRNGQDCGGAYIKLLTAPSGNLSLINDQTPYTIMFGPDKCGSDYKLHFIFTHLNKKSGAKREIHWKNSHSVASLSDAIIDGKWHLFRLILRPDNSFEVMMDKRSVGKGKLFEDFSPPINADPDILSDEEKPEDWDDREMISDPDAVKPEGWDDDEPANIPDPEAKMPDGWLEEESPMILNPEVQRPEDWEEDRDGSWEAPLIPNPKCESAPGCGPWNAPTIPNPQYRDEWRRPLIPNPNYQGKWAPKKVPNPDFYEDKNPYQMQPIDAVAFELWTLSDGIIFDNILITSDLHAANMVAEASYQVKKELNDAETDNWFKNLVKSTNKKPWLWAVYLVVIAVPLVLFIGFCCVSPVSSPSNNDQNIAKTKVTHPFQCGSYQVNHGHPLNTSSSYGFKDVRFAEGDLNDLMNSWEADHVRTNRFQAATGCSYRPTFEQFKEKLANIEESERYYEENEECEERFETYQPDEENRDHDVYQIHDQTPIEREENQNFDLLSENAQSQENNQEESQDVNNCTSESLLETTKSGKDEVPGDDALLTEPFQNSPGENEENSVDDEYKSDSVRAGECFIQEKPLRRRKKSSKGKKQEERAQKGRNSKGKLKKAKVRRD